MGLEMKGSEAVIGSLCVCVYVQPIVCLFIFFCSFFSVFIFCLEQNVNYKVLNDSDLRLFSNEIPQSCFFLDLFTVELCEEFSFNLYNFLPAWMKL